MLSVVLSKMQMLNLAKKISDFIIQEPLYYKGLALFLYGELGSGKTTFAAMIINEMMKIATNDSRSTLNVTSPTFSIVNQYKIPIKDKNKKLEIYHLDLYRIKCPSELFEIGLEEMPRYGINIIEWPEILEETKTSNIYNQPSINMYETIIKIKINAALPHNIHSSSQNYKTQELRQIEISITGALNSSNTKFKNILASTISKLAPIQ